LTDKTFPDRDYRHALLRDGNTLRFLRLMIGLMLGSSAAYLAAALIVSGDGLFRSAGVFAAFISASVAYGLIRRDRLEAGVHLLVWGAWLSVVLQVVLSNGLMSRSLMAFPLIIVLAGWLLPSRGVLAVCLATLLAGAALALGEQAGLLPLRMSPSPPLLVWLAFTIYTGLSATLAYFIFRGFHRHHESMHRLGANLQTQLNALSTREAELHLVMESVPLMLFHGDRQKRCLYANRSYADFYAAGQRNLIGLTVREIISAENYDGKAVDATLGRVLMGERVAYRASRKSAHGDVRMLDILMIPEPGAEGGTQGFFAIFRDITEELQAETALRSSEDKFAKVFHASPVAISISRMRDGLYLDVNDAFVEQFGWTREEMLGHSSVEIGLWPSQGERERWTAELGLTGRTRNRVTTLLAKSGETHTVIVSAERIQLGGEECVVGLVHDITDRLEAEAALRESKERLQLAAASGGVGLWEWDVPSGGLDWNAQLKAIFGLPEEAEGLTLERFVASIHDEDRERVRQAFMQALETRAEFDCEYRIVRPDGSTRWIVARGRGQYDAAGQPQRMVGTAIDVTERRLAEAALQEREARLREAQRIGHFGSWELDIPSQRVRFSDELHKIYELDRSSFGGTWQDLLGLVHPDDLPAMKEAWRKAGKAEGEFVLRHRILMADGRIKHLFVRFEVFRDGEGKPVRALGTAQDITEQVLAREEVQRLNDGLEARVAARTAELTAANRELESFAYSISHDLRAPLRGIDGFSHLLAEEYAEKLDATGRDYLERVRRAAQRMGELIDDILELSRVTRQDMRRVRVDLSQIAAEAIEERARVEPGRRVEVSIEPGCIALGDPQLLRVLMQNLLENAWKYSRKADPARIAFGRETLAGETVFFVRDNGVGFDMKYADRLFSPFQRLHKPEEFEGSGIGLATVARVAHRHGGRVWAEASPDQGATLRFTLGRAN
jgi:PAS domain S-box-containing protein